VSTRLSPQRLAPYFVLAALVHAGSVATRFDTLAGKLPAGVADVLMVVQFPLLVLSGYFESRLEYGATLSDFPLWMRIRSKPVKLAFTFGFMYVCLIPLQTWNVSIGPLDPTPPTTFPEQQRAMWFAMFTAGMFFPFYLGATGLLVPVLRAITWPLKKLPTLVAGILALAVGGGIGLVVMALVSSKQIGEFIKAIKDEIAANPTYSIAILAITTFGPLIVGLFEERE
jgi:hypothetical protein